MSTLFVTASGTEIGKTFVCRRLIAELMATGHAPDVLKPVVSGFDPAAAADSDPGLLAAALGLDASPARIDAISPWRFRLPLSPDVAAAREGRAIDFDALVGYCRRPSALTLIEGIGGVMTPLTATQTVLDWIEALGCPALLVVGGYLGTLSHGLTAAGALAARGVALAGVVVNAAPEPPMPAEETAETLRRFLPGVPVTTLARGERGPAPPRLLPLLEPLLGC